MALAKGIRSKFRERGLRSSVAGSVLDSRQNFRRVWKGRLRPGHRNFPRLDTAKMLPRQLDGPPNALPPQPPHPRAGPELPQPRPHLPGEAGLLQQNAARQNELHRRAFARQPPGAIRAVLRQRRRGVRQDFPRQQGPVLPPRQRPPAPARRLPISPRPSPSQSNRPHHSVARRAKCFPPRRAIGPGDPFRRPPPAKLRVRWRNRSPCHPGYAPTRRGAASRRARCCAGQNNTIRCR